MTLLFRGARETRDFGSVPPIPANSEQGSGFISSARAADTASTTEGAMQKIAIAASVNLLASVTTMLPVHQYSGDRETKMPTWMQDLGGDGHGLDDWLWMLIYSWALRGNAFGIILERDTVTGKPRQIQLQHPDDVAVQQVDGVLRWYVRGTEVSRDRVWHRRIFPIPGAVRGRSPIAQHALTIGLGIASEQFGAQFFLDGGHPTGILQNKVKTLDATAARKVKRRFVASLRGSREPVVLGGDWDYKTIQVAPNESQFLETNNYTNAECARIFGPGMPEMLGYETGGSMTYANIEQRGLDLLTFTADPWLVRVERVLSELLPNPQYIKLNRGALVRTDLLTRYQAHEIALRNRFQTVEEVRGMEDMGPMDQQQTQKWQEVGLPALITSGIVSPAWAAEQVGAPTDGLSTEPTPAVPTTPAVARSEDA